MLKTIKFYFPVILFLPMAPWAARIIGTQIVNLSQSVKKILEITAKTKILPGHGETNDTIAFFFFIIFFFFH